MKILITGGVKSGKSRHAEKRILAMANGIKPVYLATTELNDSETVSYTHLTLPTIYSV